MSNLRIAELDFDQIKTNLKTFLQSQDQFTDYDFEGSGLSVLIDLLAYNTHYNAYLANMVVNEMFLDSAVKRSSAVSIAKHLGYTPRSVKGAQATVNLTVNNPTGFPNNLTLERYTPFTTKINNLSYTFYNLEPITIQPSAGVYRFPGVNLKEGVLAEYSFGVVDPGPDEKYAIQSTNIDITSMLVTVQVSATDTAITTYTLSTDISGLTDTSTNYFIEENTQGLYQIYFGDGVIGKKLSPGNIIRVRYLNSSGAVCNISSTIAQDFTPDATIGGSTSIVVQVVSNSTNGADKETISSIKFNAPLANLARNRAVTKRDYETLIKANYTQIEAVAVWGGEENDTPAYGRVFISLKPYMGYTVDNIVKDSIKNTILKERQVITVTPEFVDPDYIYVNLGVQVKYNKNITTQSASTIGSQVDTALRNYFASDLQQFSKNFYYSKVIDTVVSSNPAIVGTLVNMSLQKRIVPILNVNNSFVNINSIKFGNKLHPGEITSTKFYIVYDNEITEVTLKDTPDTMPPDYNGTGSIKLYKVDDNTFVSTIGAVNYATGIITINSLTVVGFPPDQFDIRITGAVQEESYDVEPLRNQIIVVDDSDANSIAGRSSGLAVTVAAI